MRRYPILFAVILMTFIVGCNSESGTETTSENGTGNASESNGDIVELIFWRQEHEPEVLAMEKLIESFEEEHPNIKVNMEVKVDYETAIRTALAGGTAPDVMNLDGPTLASYADNGAIIPLDEFYERDGGKDDILEPVVESLTYNEKMYAAPLNDASLAMLYNKNLFEENGIEFPSEDVNEAWYWDEVLDAAKKVNDPDNGIYGWGPSMGISSGEGQVFSIMPLIWQSGGEILSEDLTTASGYLDTEESKRALDFLRSLPNEEGVTPKEDLEEGFANERIGIIVAGPWEIGRLEQDFPDFVLGEDYGVAPLWRDTEQVTPMGSWNMAITSQSDYPEEAWLFVNWVTGKDGAKVWYEETNNLPARYSTMESYDTFNEYPMNIYADQATNFARPRPVTPEYVTISQVLGDMFEDLMINNSEVDTVVEQAVQEINSALE